MSSSQRSETGNGAHLRVHGPTAVAGGVASPSATAAVLAATVLVGDRRAIVQEDGDVDTHDGDDAAHVQVHHKDPLEGQRTNVVVHHLRQAEGQHQQYQELAVH